MAKPRSKFKKVKWLFGKEIEIPEEWEVKKFNEIFDFLRTGTNSRSDLSESGDVQYIHYGDIHTKWNLILECKSAKIPFIENDKIKNLSLLKDGDLIIADASEDHEGSGASILLKNIENKQVVSGLHTIALRDNSQITQSEFRAYITSIKFVKIQIIAQVTGISVFGLSKTNLKKMKIPIPLLPEQQKIASILSGVDALIESTQKVIEKTGKLKKGLMQNLLTKGISHTKFKKVKSFFGKYDQIPEIWKHDEIQNICDKITSGGTPSRNNLKYYKGKIMWIKSGELNDTFILDSEEKITKKGLNESSAKLFTKGTILIAMYGATIGRTGIITKESATNQAICAILPVKSINSFYLQQLLIFKKNILISFGMGAGQPNINQEIIKTFFISLPPLPEQQKIASILSRVDAYIQKNQEYKKKMERLKKELMQKLLTGQIRVKIDH